jgi:hypothetical protein
MKKLLLIVLLIAFDLSAAQALNPVHQFNGTTGPVAIQKATLHGHVVDARTGEPIAKVKVIVSGSDQNTTTDENGAFTLDNLPVGPVDLYITTVTFGLVKKTITLKEGDNKDFEIALNEDAAALTERVTVNDNPFQTTESSLASAQMLNKRELQELSSVLLSDPIRAAQALPGVATNDDYRSEFAVRGAGFDRIGLYLDGILTESLVHTVAGGYPDTGSLSVINADTVAAVSLLSGAFPATYGNRTAAILDVQTRDGNRVKPAGRFAASLSGLAGIVDGPFAKGRGAYLFAARKSYVAYLVKRFNDQFHYTNNPPILNFADGQSKVVYDLNKRNQIGFTIILGDFVFDRNRDRNLLGINQVFRGNARNLLINGQWSFTPNPRLFFQTRVFGLRTTFKNTRYDDKILEDGTRTQIGVRSDVSYQIRPSHRLEAGLYLRRLSVDSFTQFFFFVGPASDFGSFNRSGTEQGYYLQDTWNSERRGVSLTGGARVEHSSATGETVVSPRGALVWSIDKNWKLRLGAGRYYQFPDFELMFGRLGNPALKSERATHYNASIERLFGNRTRLLGEVYDREEADLFFSLNEPRLTGTLLTFGGDAFQNSLSGHARGFELTVQRRSANKLAGWLSYAYSRTLLNDRRDGLSFVSDVDQRHTINAYGSYRITDTWNFSSEWRYGSGQPIPGFFRQAGADYFLSNQRNLTRQPSYNRIDARVSKAFLFKKWKLTVTGEVLNLLNRSNVRYAGFDGFLSNGRVVGQLDRVLPIVPSAGIVIEF